MRPLTIIVTVPDAERLRGALVIASAQAALNGAASLFLQLDAVALLHKPILAPRDEAHRAAGLPPLASLLEEALALGVRVVACQSGLALRGMTIGDLPDGIVIGGPIGVLAEMTDDERLLIA